MNILNEIVKGASQQFGRELGRAGANAILKGKNYYSVKSVSDYSGRIKASDSEIVRAIKEILKVKFVSTNKANVSRLIDITDLIIGKLSFNGVETLNQINDINNLIEQYNDKFDHGSVLIDDDFKDKSLDYLKDKRAEFVELISQFNNEIKSFIKTNLESAMKKKRDKKLATILSCPFIIVGCLGFHLFYLRQSGYGILYILLFPIFGLSALFSLINFIQLLIMSEQTFNTRYNPEYTYYSQFNYEN